MMTTVFLRAELAAAGLLALTLTLASAAGCDNSTSTEPLGPKASLVIAYEPNPVSHFEYGKWNYTISVTETAGVGVHMYGWVREGYSGAGEQYISEKYDEMDFVEYFDGCGGEGNYLERGSTRCAYMEIDGGRNNGSETHTFYGIDDFGNEVSAEGRLYLR